MLNWRIKSPGIVLLAGLSAFSGSCFFRHQKLVFTPPPARARLPLPPSVPPVLPGPPEIAGDPSTNVPPELATSIPDLAPPPAPKPQQKKSVATTPPKPTAPAAPDQPSSQPPRLVQLFTPEQEREYNHNIDESLDRVRRALAILSRKSLNSDQSEAANRIAAFQKQAEQARDEHDLAGADLLARRAATLADDLLTRVP